MAKKRITKASKHRLLFFGTISIGIIVYFVFSLSYYMMNIYHLKSEEKRLSQNLTSLKYDEKNLKTEIEKLKDPEYLARYARENYLYSKDGEIVIKLKKEDQVVNSITKETDHSYIFFGGMVILLLIVGYVIRKSKPREKKERVG